jgi:hypothetical protein
MLKKSHVLVLGVATAGLIGLGAPMAGAATVSGPSSLVNVSNNQIPLQLCGNDVYGNVIGGQVPVAGDALVASLLSPGSYTVAKGVNNRGCVELNNQQNKHGDDGASLVNVSNNQIPVQVCGNDVFINGIGGQVPLYGIAGAISALSPSSVTKATAINNQGCASASNQQNGRNWADQDGTGKNGMGGPKHGKCPCQGDNAANDNAANDGAVTSTSNLPGQPANGDAVNTNVAGTPVNGGAITSGLSGSPVSGVVNSALQGSK